MSARRPQNLASMLLIASTSASLAFSRNLDGIGRVFLAQHGHFLL